MFRTPEHIGPYRIAGALGKGGMGVVYRGVHRDSGAQVAVKTVSVLSATVLQGLRREIQALARLRHPGIVRIVDHGVEAGVPWYAMELLEAPTLREVVRGLFDPGASRVARTGSADLTRARHSRDLPRADWTKPFAESSEPEAETDSEPGLGWPDDLGSAEPVEEKPRWQEPPQVIETLRRQHAEAGELGPLHAVLTLVRRLCAPLAFLHGEGIVHGDLKPENVLVLETGRPVLVDFGLTSRFSADGGREALEVGRAPAGTAAYMAPEQIRGELLDARADLYAVGCILYEMLTGRRPFLAKTAEAVLAKHLEAVPHRPSELAPQVPPRLDELVFQLLAKRREQRRGSAEDLAVALVSLGAKDDLPEPGPAPRPHLYRPGLAGREDLLASLEARLRGLREAGGGVVLVGGEAGVGKTRLVQELARRAERSGIRVLSGEGRPPGAGEAGGPLEALRRPLRAVADRCREHGWSETERVLGPRGPLLALYEPELASLPGQSEYGASGELAPEAARTRLWSHLEATLRAYAAAGTRGAAPLLLVLEDLHLTDELSLGFVEHLLLSGAEARRRPAASAILVLCTYRSDEDLTAPPAEPLRRLLGLPGLTKLDLGRLDERSVGLMVRDMLALAEPPPLFVRFLTTHSEGNPIFVIEYLRTAVAEGLLYRDEQGRWQVHAEDDARPAEAVYEELPLPRSLWELVGRRLDGLSPGARRLAEAASVLGREVDPERLEQILEQDGASQPLDPLDELLRRHVLEELEPTGAPPLLRFLHDKIREVAYEGMAAGRRRTLHLRAAEVLEAAGPGAASPGELARHWDRAGEPARARECYLAAARTAQVRSSLREAERMYRAYLALAGGAQAEAFEARIELATAVLRYQGRTVEAMEECRGALELARATGLRIEEGRSLRSLGLLCREAGRVEEAAALCQQAEALQREIGDRWGLGLTLGEIAAQRLENGQFEPARECFEEALALHRELGNRRAEGKTLGNLAALHYIHGHLEEAIRLFELARAMTRELGDLQTEGLALSNLAILHATQGRPEEAQEFFERSLALRRAIGDRRGEGKTLSNMGTLQMALGSPDVAHGLFEQALQIHRELGNRRFEGVTLGSLAALHGSQGRLALARTLFAETLAIHREVQNHEFEAGALVMRARMERKANELAAAASLLDEAEPLLRGLGESYDRFRCLCERGHLALAHGGSADALLAEARQQASRMGLGPKSELGRSLDLLERSVFRARESGRLVSGECVEEEQAG